MKEISDEEFNEMAKRYTQSLADSGRKVEEKAAAKAIDKVYEKYMADEVATRAIENLAKSVRETKETIGSKLVENHFESLSNSEIFGFSVDELRTIRSLMKVVKMTPEDLIEALRDLADEKIPF
jgi:hypothetical protein